MASINPMGRMTAHRNHTVANERVNASHSKVYASHCLGPQFPYSNPSGPKARPQSNGREDGTKKPYAGSGGLTHHTQSLRITLSGSPVPIFEPFWPYGASIQWERSRHIETIRRLRRVCLTHQGVGLTHHTQRVPPSPNSNPSGSRLDSIQEERTAHRNHQAQEAG